jgi:hypothetical protein
MYAEKLVEENQQPLSEIKVHEAKIATNAMIFRIKKRISER